MIVEKIRRKLRNGLTLAVLHGLGGMGRGRRVVRRVVDINCGVGIIERQRAVEVRVFAPKGRLRCLEGLGSLLRALDATGSVPTAARAGLGAWATAAILGCRGVARGLQGSVTGGGERKEAP